MTKRAGLGRGLGAFFGDDYDSRQPAGTNKIETEAEAGTQSTEKKSLKDLDMVLPAAKKPQKSKNSILNSIPTRSLRKELRLFFRKVKMKRKST